jgi:hypothetical protein
LVAALLVTTTALRAAPPPDRLTPLIDKQFAVGFFDDAPDISSPTGLQAAFRVVPDTEPSLRNLGSCGNDATVEVDLLADDRYLGAISASLPNRPKPLPPTPSRQRRELMQLRAITHRSTDQGKRIDQLEEAIAFAKVKPYKRRTAARFVVAVEGGDMLRPEISSKNHHPLDLDIFNGKVEIRRVGDYQSKSTTMNVKSWRLSTESENVPSSSGSVFAVDRDLLGQLAIYRGLGVKQVEWTILFTVPVVASRGIGSCWIRLPGLITSGSNNIDVAVSTIGGGLFVDKAAGDVGADASFPRPNNQDEWICDRNRPEACGAWALINAPWQGRYRDFFAVDCRRNLFRSARTRLPRMGPSSASTESADHDS